MVILFFRNLLIRGAELWQLLNANESLYVELDKTTYYHTKNADDLSSGHSL